MKKIFETIKKISDNKKRSNVLTAILIILQGLYIISFIHPTGQGMRDQGQRVHRCLQQGSVGRAVRP
jgi:hypothetical protein